MSAEFLTNLVTGILSILGSYMLIKLRQNQRIDTAIEQRDQMRLSEVNEARTEAKLIREELTRIQAALVEAQAKLLQLPEMEQKITDLTKEVERLRPLAGKYHESERVRRELEDKLQCCAQEKASLSQKIEVMREVFTLMGREFETLTQRPAQEKE
jgi:hypothetical protein